MAVSHDLISASLADVSFHCSWVCRYVLAVAVDNRDASTLVLPLIWRPESTKPCHRSPVFFYLDFPSLSLPQVICRNKSESADAARLSPYPICFPSLNNCSSYLAMKDLVEVCSLSRRIMFQSIFPRLRRDLRFFHIPLPAAPTVFLAVHLPFMAILRAYPVPHVFQSGADLSISPAVPYSRWAIGKSPYLTAHLFGSSLSASLACLA